MTLAASFHALYPGLDGPLMQSDISTSLLGNGAAIDSSGCSGSSCHGSPVTPVRSISPSGSLININTKHHRQCYSCSMRNQYHAMRIGQ